MTKMQGDVSSDRPHYGPKTDPREMSEKELARWRAAYANAAKPCLCKELLDHIAAQAKQLAAANQAREEAEAKVVEVRQGRTDAYASIVRVEGERDALGRQVAAYKTLCMAYRTGDHRLADRALNQVEREKEALAALNAKEGETP